ncbi:histamine H2 receptor [Nematostella vectensis]|nr:histamine H2 receptor [Nematostella vectensis]
MAFFFIDHCVNSTIPDSAAFTATGILILLALITIPGNLLVVLAVLLDPNKDLRSPFNYFIANLAFADLVVGLVTEPVAIIHHFQIGLGVLEIGSSVIHMSFFISCTASVLSLSVLTLDRYIAITSPFKYKTKLNPGHAAILCAIVWTISIVFPFLYFHIGYIQYAFVFVNTAVLITFIVLLFAYIRIYKIFRKQVREWDVLHSGTSENRRKKQAIRYEQKLTKTFLIMLAIFVWCYFTASGFIYLINLCEACSCHVIHWSRDLQFLFILLSSGLNPFLYSWRLRSYRRAFACLVCMGRKRELARKASFELRSFRRSTRGSSLKKANSTNCNANL